MSKLEWQPIARMRTHEQVIAEIETQLRAGALHPGDRLPPERQLAEKLGVSRGAVREALRILEAIGVIDANPGRGPAAGSVIVSDSAGGLGLVLRMHLQSSALGHDDLLEVRVLLEGLSARKASATIDDEDIKRLRALIEQMKTTKSVVEYNALDMAFHVGIAKMSGNQLVAELMVALRSTVRRAMESAFEQLDDAVSTMGSLTREHSAILDAIEGGDGDKAARLVSDHITGFYHLANVNEFN